MIRPYIAIGATMMISLTAFCLAEFQFTVAVLIAALVCSALFFFFRSKNSVLNTVFICSLSLIVSSSVFITKTVTDYQPALLNVSDGPCTISGTLYEYEEQYEKHYYTLTDVTVNGVEIEHKIRVSTDIYKSVKPDDVLTFTQATVYELGASTGNQNAYKSNGLYLGAYTSENFEAVKAHKHSLNYYLNEIRLYISETLGVYMDSEYASVADAMLTGNQSEIEHKTLLSFRYSGIAHLFAVSGFHLSLWTSALSMLLNKAFKDRKYIGNIICMVFVLFFMALTGFTKSVMRAGIMLLIFLFGKIIRYQSDPLNSLFIAVTVILLINPFAVMSVSLQMSFLATLGILILTAPPTQPLKKLKKKIKSKTVYSILSFVYTTVMISVIASLFTMPVSALTFGYISAAAPITNLLCTLPSQGIMLLSGLCVLTSKLAFIAKPLSFFTALFTRYVIFVTEKISSLEHAVIDTSSVLMQAVLLTSIILMSVFLIIHRKDIKKLRITLFVSAAVIITVSLTAAVIQDSSVKITVADVGNGTSIVMDTGESDIIIGCGGSTYKSYRLTNITDLNAASQFDLILIPRNTKTESEYAYMLLGRYEFENAVVSKEKYPPYLTERFPENTVRTNSCTVNIDDETVLEYIDSDEFSGARITQGDFTCTVLFRPLSDFSAVPDSWRCGSLLITRQSLPETDISGFENIIISSSKEVIYTNSNIYTTKYSGQTVYRMYPFGTVTITEEKHDH